MKFRISIPLILITLFVGFTLLSTSSCSRKAYRSSNKVSYNRSDRIKVYKKPKSTKSYTHSTPVRKKYRIKN